MSINRRLGRLEKVLGASDPPHEWPVEDQMEGLLHTLRLHRLGRSVYQATDRELELLDALIHEGIPEVWRDLCTRMEPARQPERERWLREDCQEAKRDRELAHQRQAWHAGNPVQHADQPPIVPSSHKSLKAFSRPVRTGAMGRDVYHVGGVATREGQHEERRRGGTV
jgi:hypothetical protein